MQRLHAHRVRNRIEFNRIVVFVFGLVRCGLFYWILLLHLFRCTNKYIDNIVLVNF